MRSHNKCALNNQKWKIYCQQSSASVTVRIYAFFTRECAKNTECQVDLRSAEERNDLGES